MVCWPKYARHTVLPLYNGFEFLSGLYLSLQLFQWASLASSVHTRLDTYHLDDQLPYTYFFPEL